MSQDGIWSSLSPSRGQKQFLPCLPHGRKIIIRHCIVVFCEKQKPQFMSQNCKAQAVTPAATFGCISLSTSLLDLSLHGLLSQAGHCNGFLSAHSITPAFQKRAPPHAFEKSQPRLLSIQLANPLHQTLSQVEVI